MKATKNFIFDFDSTLISVEAMDIMVPLVCERRGIADATTLTEDISNLTTLAMNGELNFSQALQQRLQLLQLIPRDIEALIPLLENCLTKSMLRHLSFFEEHQHNIFVISGGFEEYIIPVVKKLTIKEEHVFANRFISSENSSFLTCDPENALSRDQGKLHALRSLPLKGEIIVIGDGYTDYKMKKFGLAHRFYLYTEHADRSDKITDYDARIQSLDELIEKENG